MTEEELQLLFENRPGFGIFRNFNWILLAIGAIVTIIGIFLSSTQESTGFKMGY